MQTIIQRSLKWLTYALALTAVFAVSWLLFGGKSDGKYTIEKDLNVLPTAEADVPYSGDGDGGDGDDGCDDGGDDCA